MEFTEENYYFCQFCGKYSAKLILEDERDWVTHKTYECVICGRESCETVDND